jgi:hypothetical protein
MDIKRKSCDIRNWGKKHSFLDVSSTNTDTLVPSLYQCVETRSTEIFDCCLLTFSGIIWDFRTSLREFLDPVVNPFTRQTLLIVNKKYLYINILYIKSLFFTKENAQQKPSLPSYTPQARSSFWLLKPVLENEHARLLPTMSWSWTVLLPSDTHRKLITSITAVLLPVASC